MAFTASSDSDGSCVIISNNTDHHPKSPLHSTAVNDRVDVVFVDSDSNSDCGHSSAVSPPLHDLNGFPSSDTCFNDPSCLLLLDQKSSRDGYHSETGNSAVDSESVQHSPGAARSAFLQDPGPSCAHSEMLEYSGDRTAAAAASGSKPACALRVIRSLTPLFTARTSRWIATARWR